MNPESLLSEILTFKQQIQIIEHNVATLDADDVYLYDYLKLYVEEISKAQHQVDRLYTEIRNGKFPKEMGFEYNIARRFTLKHLEMAAILLDETELYDYPFLIDHGKKIDFKLFSLAGPIVELEKAAYGTKDEQQVFAECKKLEKTFETLDTSNESLDKEDEVKELILQKTMSIIEEDDEDFNSQNAYADLVIEIQDEEERIKEYKREQDKLRKEQIRQERAQKQIKEKEFRRSCAKFIEEKTPRSSCKIKAKKNTSKRDKTLSPGEEYLKKLREQRRIAKQNASKPVTRIDNTRTTIDSTSISEDVLLQRTRDFRNYLLNQGINENVLHGIMVSVRNDFPSLMRETIDKEFSTLFEYTDIRLLDGWIKKIEEIKDKEKIMPPRITFFSRWLKMYVEFLKHK